MSWLKYGALAATAAYQFRKMQNVPRPKGMPVGQLVLPFGGGEYIGIPREDRLRHLHILGGTGSGKTTLMTNLIFQDLREGNGICVIDPKGDMIDEILTFMPTHRIDDVLLFDATDRENPIGFNMLEWVPEEERSRTASDVLSVFKKLYASESWGPRLEYYLRYTILTLLSLHGSTLLDVHSVLTNEEYLAALLENISDPTLKNFWNQEYFPLTGGQRGQVVSPILNKIGPWVTYPECRNIIGQMHSCFDLRDLMDNRKILLVKIPYGAIGEDLSAFLGAMIVSKVQLAAMSRSGLHSSQKVPFFLYVDEFQNFVTSAFDKILTEARSYGLGLIIANQFKEQLSNSLMKSVEHNVAVQLQCYQKGKGDYRAEYIVLKDMDRPTATIRTLPPVKTGSYARRRNIEDLSRLKYSRPRAEIESQLAELQRRRNTNFFCDPGEGNISFREEIDD